MGMKDITQIVLLSLELFFINAKVVLFERYFVINGSKVEGNWHIQNNVEKFSICCLLCDRATYCNAVNYNKETETCELLNGGTDETYSLTTSFGWKAFFKSLKDINPMTNAIATQSSTFYFFVPERAIDGDTNGFDEANSCSHTEFTADMWWMVDFQTVSSVSAVVIWNRMQPNCNDGRTCWSRLRDLLLTVGRTRQELESANNICGTYIGPPLSETDNPVRIDCGRKMYGRFLRITKPSSRTGALTLCEVQVIQ